MDSRSWTDIAVPVGLLFVGAIPVAFSAAILIWVALGEVPEDHPRLAETPLPFAAHALGGLLFGLLGPIQFGPRLRRRWPRAHRVSGRLVVLGGLVLGLSGLWLLALYPAAATWPLQSGRLFMAVALLSCMPLAVIAALRGDITAHRAWMIRGFAVGIAAGTQSLVLFPYFLFVGEPVGIWADLVLLSGWLINITVAEWAIRRGRTRPAMPAMPAE